MLADLNVAWWTRDVPKIHPHLSLITTPVISATLWASIPYASGIRVRENATPITGRYSRSRLESCRALAKSPVAIFLALSEIASTRFELLLTWRIDFWELLPHTSRWVSGIPYGEQPLRFLNHDEQHSSLEPIG